MLLCFFTLFFTHQDVKTSEHAPRSRLGSSAQPSGFRPPVQILALQPSTKAPFERESGWSRILMKILFSRAGVGQTCALHGPEGNNSPTGTRVLEWWWCAGGRGLEVRPPAGRKYTNRDGLLIEILEIFFYLLFFSS